MKQSALTLALALIAVLVTATPAHAAYLETSGKVTILRVQDVGQQFGPPGDVIDADVIFTLSTSPGKAYGFQLRAGTHELARQGMLDLLRDAFANNWTVVINFNIEPGRNNGMANRLWIIK